MAMPAKFLRVELEVAQPSASDLNNRPPIVRRDLLNLPKPSTPPVVPWVASRPVGQRALLIEGRPQKKPHQFA